MSVNWQWRHTQVVRKKKNSNPFPLKPHSNWSQCSTKRLQSSQWAEPRHVGPGCFTAGWGQAGQMLRSLTNSLQALRSGQGGQQRAEWLQEENTRVFSDCQLIPQFYFSGFFTVMSTQCSPCLHRVLACICRFNQISSFTGQNYSSLSGTELVGRGDTGVLSKKKKDYDWHESKKSFKVCHNFTQSEEISALVNKYRGWSGYLDIKTKIQKHEHESKKWL